VPTDQQADLVSDLLAPIPRKGGCARRPRDARPHACPGRFVAWFGGFQKAFPDVSWEPLHEHEAGNTAIDEGYVVGTHTGPLDAPTGESIPPTGKRVRVRSLDIATVEDGAVTSHRFYFDQMEFLGQLGLAPEA
jgi:ketosteroid isomerase-like protein